MNGEEDEKSIHTYDNEQIVAMIKEMNEMKNKKFLFIGFFLMIMGIALLVLSQFFGGTDIKDFISGFMIGVSVSEMLMAVFFFGRFIAHKNKND